MTIEVKGKDEQKGYNRGMEYYKAAYKEKSPAVLEKSTVQFMHFYTQGEWEVSFLLK